MTFPLRTYVVSRQRSFEEQYRAGREVFVRSWVEFQPVGEVEARSASEALTAALSRFGGGAAVEPKLTGGCVGGRA